MPAKQSKTQADGSSVEITVRDKVAHRTEVFHCSLDLLSDGMQYFQPLIQKQLDEQAKGGANAAGPITLKVNCSTEVFGWLLSHLRGEGPQLTYANAVSVVLSSHFLRMDALTDTALEYVRDNLADVLVSGVDMDCIPGELLGRFCTFTREYHVAAALLELYERGEEDHAGRSFLGSVARHLAMIRLSAKVMAPTMKSRWDQVPASFAPPTPSKGIVQREVFSSTRVGGDEKASGADNGLRWCRLCGILYDSIGIQRLLSKGKCYEPPCRALTNNEELRMGPRGEVFSSHVALDSAVVVSPPSTFDTPVIEQWAWRCIGSILMVICTVCHCPCSLIEALHHGCPGAQFTTEEPGYTSNYMDYILRWLQLWVEELPDGNCQPLCAPHAEATTLEVESIVMPRYRQKSTKASEGNNEPPRLLNNTSLDASAAFTWHGHHKRVLEVVTGSDCGVDVDVLNYYERSMIAKLLESKQNLAPPKPAPRRSLQISSQSQALSYCYVPPPEVAPPSGTERKREPSKNLQSSGSRGAPLRQKQAFASTVGTAVTPSASARATLLQSIPAARKANTGGSGRAWQDASFPGDYLKRSVKVTK